VGAVPEALLEAVRKNRKRLEGERAEVMGLGMHIGIIFICATGNSVMIHFPRKRCLYVSTTRAIQTQDQGAKKLGGLKKFVVHSVLKKEPRFDEPKLIYLIGTVICPKRKKKYWRDRPIVLSTTMPK
jgi:hypothetical protein